MYQKLIKEMGVSTSNLYGFATRCLVQELDWDDIHLCGQSHGAYIASIVRNLKI